MKSIAKICLIALAALSMAAYSVQAQTDSSTTSTNAPAPKPKPKAHGKPYSGTVDSVDADGKTITVLSASGTTKTYQITSKTRIKKDGEPATLEDVKKGDKVRGMSHEDKSGDMVATTVNLGIMKHKSVPPSSPPASAPPTPDTTK